MLVLVLVGVGVWVSGVPESNDNGYATFRPHWGLYAVVIAGALLGFVLFRRLRRWAARPRWLLPVAAGVLIVAAVPALKPYTIAPELTPLTCVPLLDAWHPVVARPSPADMALWNSVLTPPPRSEVSTPAQLQAFLARVQAEKATPAYKAAEHYAAWTFGPGECVSKSRQDLSISLGVLAGGGIAVTGATVAVVRRRSRRTVGL